MVHDLLFPELLLGMLPWLGVHAYLQWQRGSATKLPPAQRTTSLLQAPKPFAGLTRKPHCEACEQSRVHLDQSPLFPPPVIGFKRGRPRTVDTHTQYCPQRTCAYYGWVGRGNIRANGHPDSGAWRQFHCVVCDSYFLETRGTLLYRKPGPAERIVHAVAAVAEGLGIQAVARVFEVDPTTVQAWLSEATLQLAAFSRSLFHEVHVNHVQFDELFTLVREAKAGPGTEAEANENCPRSPAWIWAAIDPLSKLLLALAVGKHPLEMAQGSTQRIAVRAFIEAETFGPATPFANCDAVDGFEDLNWVMAVGSTQRAVQRIAIGIDDQVAFEAANPVFTRVAALALGPLLNLLTLAS